MSHLPYLLTLHGGRISATVVSVSEPKKHKMRNEAARLGDILLQQIEYDRICGLCWDNGKENGNC